MRGSSNRLAPLTFWVVALSVAIAVVGSSTLLFPGPDIGERPTAPSGRDIVARVVAPVFGASPAQEGGTSPAPAAEAPAAGLAAGAPLVTIRAGVTVERPVRTRPDGGTNARPDRDSKHPGSRADHGKGKGNDKAKHKSKHESKGKAKGAGKDKADKPPHGKAHAEPKSQGHGQGHLKSKPPRGPKQPHVQPAKGHGKSKGHARAHARAGR
jgi:hypothetical protein